MKSLRMSRRVAVNFSAAFEQGTKRIEGSLKEIGEGGLRFECREEIPLNSKGHFCLKPFTEEPELRIEGEVIYMQEAAGGKGGGRAYQYGARFTDVSGEKKESIARVIRFATVRSRYSVSKSDIIKDG